MKKLNFDRHLPKNFATEEAFNLLRTNIKFCGGDVKCIMVTSCTEDEGKSYISYQVARSFAEQGNKVLLIDADLRKSVYVGRYGIKSDSTILGLSHYLSDQAEIEDIVFKTDIENMGMILSGPMVPNPTALINREKFKILMEKMRNEYDYVILDCPPIGAVVDAALISKYTDGTLFVIASNHTSHKFAQLAKKQLDVAEAKILGVVLNKVDKKASGYYKKYYGKKYGEYY